MTRMTVTIICAFAIVSCEAMVDAEAEYAREDAHLEAVLKIVEFKRKNFNRMGAKLKPGTLINCEEAEMVDSFLHGRDFYRCGMNGHAPLSERLEWLREIFGDDFGDFETRWRQNVAALRGSSLPTWTRERIAARLDELAAMEREPIMNSSIGCRSAPYVDAVDVECMHCGRHTVYSKLEDLDYNKPPAYYKAVARELANWGLHVAVDGKAACPDCSQNTNDFRLSEMPTLCRARPGCDFSSHPSLWYVKPEDRLHVVSVFSLADTNVVYVVRCTVHEAWINCDKWGHCCVYDRPGGRIIADCSSMAELEFIEPKDETVVDKGGLAKKFIKIKNFKDRIAKYVKASRVEVVERKRSSELRDIPPTFFIFDGSRFLVDEKLANQMLAFVQGYDVVISGFFHDRSPIQGAIPRLRDVLVNSARNNTLRP